MRIGFLVYGNIDGPQRNDRFIGSKLDFRYLKCQCSLGFRSPPVFRNSGELSAVNPGHRAALGFVIFQTMSCHPVRAIIRATNFNPRLAHSQTCSALDIELQNGFFEVVIVAATANSRYVRQSSRLSFKMLGS